MDSQYENVLSRHGLSFDLRDEWLVVPGRGDTPRQGWKIHISAWSPFAALLLTAVLPYLRRTQLAFKVARSDTVLKRLNLGELGPAQRGKFITIYPGSDVLLQTVDDLIALTLGSDAKGPKVPSDRWLGGLVYARYGAFGEDAQYRDPLGMWSPAILTPEGEPASDVRGTSFVVPEWAPRVPWLTEDYEPEGVEDASDPVEVESLPPKSRVDLYTVVGSLREEARTRLHLALRIEDEVLTPVILKEALGSDNSGRALIENEWRIYRSLEGRSLLIPRCWAPFEWNANLYLPIEHLSGTRLSALMPEPIGRASAAEREAVLTVLRRILRALSAVHDAGVVHRDLSPNNVLVAEDRVWLLDFEIACGRGEVPSSDLATRGYAPPEQQHKLPAEFSSDIYSLGALAVRLLTGQEPHRVAFASSGDRGRQLSGLGFVALPEQAEFRLRSALSSRPEARPALVDIDESLTRLATAPHHPVYPDWEIESQRFSLAEIIDSVLYKTPRTEDGLWLALHRVSPQDRGELRLRRQAMRGVAGVVYVASLYWQYGVQDFRKSDIANAVQWLLSQQLTDDAHMAGLVWGEGGVAVSVAAAIRAGLLPLGEWARAYFHDVFPCPRTDWPDVTHGMAGHALAAFRISDQLQMPELVDKVIPLLDELARGQDADGYWPLGDEQARARLTGAAHGSAGIALSLAEGYRRTGKLKYLQGAVRAFDQLEKVAIPHEEGMTYPKDASTNEVWRFWCHGGPGIAQALLRMWDVTRDGRWLSLAEKSNLGVPLYSADLSVCHGIVGNAEIDLDFYVRTGREFYLTRARTVGAYVMLLARQASDSVSWLNESYDYPLPSLYGDMGGIAHFLLRLRDERALSEEAFPLYPT